MKQLYLSVALIICILSLSIYSKAQGIYQFWGTTNYGGNNDQGVLFSARYDGTGVRARPAFEVYTPGRGSGDQAPTPYNGKLYGMMPGAGPYGMGIIYEYDPAANTYTTKAELYTISRGIGFNGIGKLVVYNNKLYGLVVEGGATDLGILIEFDPATGKLVKKHEFKNATGDYPSTNLTLYKNKLYGCTIYGGIFNSGVLYSFDLVTDSYTKLADLTVFTGIYAYGQLAVYNNRLYGTARSGGINNKGTVFEYNLVSNVLGKKADLATLGSIGNASGLTLLNNKLYGGSTQGGADNKGILFVYDPVANTLQKKIDLTTLTGFAIYGDLTVYNNKLYGLTNMGGYDDNGVVFEYDPATNKYVRKVIFSPAIGARPSGSLVVLNNRMYGVTERGGTYNKGVLFEFNPAYNGYTKKIELGNNNGLQPYGKPVYYNGKLYGTTRLGGNNDEGVIYSYDLVTQTYTVRHHFTVATGQPYAQGGMVLYNNKFYGVTTYGGNNKAGVLYEFDPLNDAYTVKHMFSATEKYPVGVPVVYNNKLYGTTHGDQMDDGGVIYEFDPATNIYTVKVQFGGPFGRRPDAGLTVYKNRLYGTTSTGGAYEGGTLFEYIPVWNGFVKRHDFEKSTGYQPGSVMVVHNDILYGTTARGGAEDWGGTIFSFNPANNVFTKKHDFLKNVAAEPYSDLTVLNNKLYGMAHAGGSINAGTLYEYNPATETFTNKTEFDALNGRWPGGGGLTAVPALIAPGTPGACQSGTPLTINSSNNDQWVPVTDAMGNAIAEINANGNNLGSIRVSFYSHNGDARQDAAGRFCLNRNITITSSSQPVRPVSIRLYIRKAEFESLKSTPNSGILNVSDLAVFKSNGSCANAMGSAALPLVAAVTNWGLDYVYTTHVDSLATFYFASKAYTASQMEYARQEVNMAASVMPGRNDATLDIKLNGNPVTGSNLMFRIYAPHELSLPVTIYDLAGKAILTTQLHLQKGAQTRSITCSQIPAGVYQAVFHTTGKVHTVRFIRQ